MDFVMQILAKVFDSFKAKNPVVAAVIVAVLIGAAYFLETSGKDVFGTNATIALQWLNWILLGLQGSRTASIVHNEKKK